MKCIYYLSPTLQNTQQIAEDLRSIGVKDWFLHVHSKDESGVVRKRLHSSNYLETLDFLRKGFIGAGIGVIAGVAAAMLAGAVEPFGMPMNWIGYLAIIFLFTCFGAWVGGLTGVANENKKIAHFNDDIEQGKYLLLIYAKDHQLEMIKEMMIARHPTAQLAAVDPHFYNPFADLELVKA